MKSLVFTLNSRELYEVCELWSDLKFDLTNVHERLQMAPENIRLALLGVLVVASDAPKPNK